MRFVLTLSALVFCFILLIPSEVNAVACDSAALEDLRSGMTGGDSHEASEILALAEELSKGCPDDAEIQLACGTAFESADRFDEAVAAYRRAAASAPDLAIPWARIAHVARLQGDLEIWELYLDSARALERDEADRQEIERAVTQSGDSSEVDSYSFKDADQISDGLRVGSKSIRPKSISKDVSGDYFVGSKGFGVNLGIVFEVADTSLRPEGSRQLEQLGRALERSAPGEKYLIEGHSSSEGDSGFNEQLSEERAKAIADALVREYGVDPSQIEYVGRGTAFPVFEGETEDRSKSRRVTVLRLYDE